MLRLVKGVLALNKCPFWACQSLLKKAFAVSFGWQRGKTNSVEQAEY